MTASVGTVTVTTQEVPKDKDDESKGSFKKIKRGTGSASQLKNEFSKMTKISSAETKNQAVKTQGTISRLQDASTEKKQTFMAQKEAQSEASQKLKDKIQGTEALKFKGVKTLGDCLKSHAPTKETVFNILNQPISQETIFKDLNQAMTWNFANSTITKEEMNKRVQEIIDSKIKTGDVFKKEGKMIKDALKDIYPEILSRCEKGHSGPYDENGDYFGDD